MTSSPPAGMFPPYSSRSRARSAFAALQMAHPHEPVPEQRTYHEVRPLLGARRALVPEGQGPVAVAVAQHLDGLRRLGLLQ